MEKIITKIIDEIGAEIDGFMSSYTMKNAFKGFIEADENNKINKALELLKKVYEFHGKGIFFRDCSILVGI